MTNYQQLFDYLHSSTALEKMQYLYGNAQEITVFETQRYESLLKLHEEKFHSTETLYFISAPGRIEVAGNHTDHNRGKVLAAAVNKDAVACVGKRTDNTVLFYSQGFGEISLNLNDLTLNTNEFGTTQGIIRGIAKQMQDKGFVIGGFEACVNSTILSGSGLSSSAAIENLISKIFDVLYNKANLDPMLQAKIGQYAENVYFGKPSGLLDQSASAIGGLVYMDYKNEQPEVIQKTFNFQTKGFTLYVVNTNSSHDDLTDAYAAIPAEMKAIASHFGKNHLRELTLNDIITNIKILKDTFGERAILRAYHFFTENNRVDAQINALDNVNMEEFLESIIASGRSSFMYLQNIYANVHSQPIALALALAENVLQGTGAWRVHGGGFAGTILTFVPEHKKAEFISTMEHAFGKNSCIALNIRPVGAYVF
ncbi:MAG: galactokinase family protein [Eubacteriales bacterium]|nr:galactokinase family protein [Eubacteriales bacterium]